MLSDGSDLVAEEMNDWMDLDGMEFYIHYKNVYARELTGGAFSICP